MKKTKIVSTLGPASTDVDTIVKLINAGANIFRFNFSHGDHPEHLGRIENVHKAEDPTHYQNTLTLLSALRSADQDVQFTLYAKIQA